MAHLASITSSMRFPEEDLTMSGACRGTLMITPLPVPSHSRLHETWRAVIRTKEKPSLPVPAIRRMMKGPETVLLGTITIDRYVVCVYQQPFVQYMYRCTPHKFIVVVGL